MIATKSRQQYNSMGQTGNGMTVTEVRPVKALISQRRRQVLLHAYLYYELGREIVSDAQWDTWARELVQLQQEHPEWAECCVEAWQFRDFDATTGFDFIYSANIIRDAGRVLKQHDIYMEKR